MGRLFGGGEAVDFQMQALKIGLNFVHWPLGVGGEQLLNGGDQIVDAAMGFFFGSTSGVADNDFPLRCEAGEILVDLILQFL